MAQDPIELRRLLGEAARLWASPDHHQVHHDWWVAFSGELSATYNVACSQSDDNAVVEENCRDALLALKKPGVIMLAGPGLATAQSLAAEGWVAIGALPLMILTGLPSAEPDTGVRALSLDELPLARELVADTYGLGNAAAAAAVPDHAVEEPDMEVWGLFDGDQLVSVFTSALSGGLVVVWSMATRRNGQRKGYGRRLLVTALRRQFAAGAQGSLLQSSAAGRRLYDGIGYSVVEHWQLWSRPRWVMGRA